MVAVDESIVEYLPVPIDDVEREVEVAHHVSKRNNGVVQLVVTRIKQHGLHLRFVVDVAAGQVEFLCPEACRHAKQEYEQDAFSHRIRFSAKIRKKPHNGGFFNSQRCSTIFR